MWTRLLTIILMLIPSTVWGGNALIYHSNYSDAHTNMKAQLEADGHTVTLSTDGAIADNLINSYDIVVDLKYNNNIGSNGRTRYQNFVQAGGILIVTGENNANFSSRNTNIEALIENKFGGSLSISGNTSGCSSPCSANQITNSVNVTQTNTDAGVSSYTSVGHYPYGAYFTGDGTWVAKNASGQILWMKWSGNQLPSGYTGEVYVTFDVNQFESAFDGTDFYDLMSDLYTEAVISVTISSGQTTLKNSAFNATSSENKVNLVTDGSNNTINIQQSGNNNFVVGTDWTSAGNITGNSNTLTIDQGNVLTSGSSVDNGLGIDITGNSNTVILSQGDAANDDGGHRTWLDIDGSSNHLTLQQKDSDTQGTDGDHFMSLDLDSSSNTLVLQQLNDNDKVMFLDINNNSNTIDISQEGTGNHYLDLTTAGSAHDIDIMQKDNGNHAARIDLGGYSIDFDLLQQGSTSQSYNVTSSCGAANGCTLSTTQGE